MDKGGRIVTNGKASVTSQQAEKVILSPEVERFIENMRRLGVCP